MVGRNGGNNAESGIQRQQHQCDGEGRRGSAEVAKIPQRDISSAFHERAPAGPKLRQRFDVAEFGNQTQANVQNAQNEQHVPRLLHALVGVGAAAGHRLAVDEQLQLLRVGILLVPRRENAAVGEAVLAALGQARFRVGGFERRAGVADGKIAEEQAPGGRQGLGAGIVEVER